MNDEVRLLLLEDAAIRRARRDRLAHPSRNIEHDLNFMETTGDRLKEIQQLIAAATPPT